jgi:hypothetical protein
MASFPVPSRHLCWRLWNSERLAPLRFYGGYFRWPLLLVVLAVAGDKLIFYGGMPLAAWARGEWDYAQAERAFAGGRDEAALVAIRQALLETRGEARFWRLAARISGRLDSPEAAYCWRQADRLDPGSTDTELSMAEAALKEGALELTDSALREVPPSARSGARYELDAGQLAQEEVRPERARYWFEQVEASRADDARTIFALAAWHGGLDAAVDQARARALFQELAARPAERLAAWRGLVVLDLRRRDFAAARADGRALIATPGAVFADRVALLDALIPGHDVDSQLAALLRTSSPGDAAQVLDWMTAHGRAEQALAWMDGREKSWRDDPTSGAVCARCLAALGDWVRLRDELRDCTWPGREPARLMWLARASLELGNGSDALSAWHRAIAACVTPADFAELARAADAFPEPDNREAEKAEAWTALINRFPELEWPWRALLADDLRRGDLVAAQKVSERLAALEPGEASVAANADLISLLRDGVTARTAADLLRLEQADPENPDVATATAYSLYLQGRFDDALAALGALDPAELRAPERAAVLGQLLAAAGPSDRAQAALDLAAAQPNLLAAQRASIERAVDLVAYRRAMTDLLHGADAATCARARDFFGERAPSGKAVFLVGQSVALGADRSRAAECLARLEPSTLNRAELLLYEGAVLHLAGQTVAAEPLLELAPGLHPDTPGVRWHRAVETWWTLVEHGAFDPSVAAGLLAAYRGLEMEEPGAAFWRSDQGRELTLCRAALRGGVPPAAVQERLEALARRVPPTPDLEAEIGYALFLQGRIEAARQRLEVLSAAERARHEPAFYYAAILRACAAMKKHDGDVALRAGVESLQVQIPAADGVPW